MKPQRFEIGQDITPNEKGPWVNQLLGEMSPNEPVFGEIYRPSGYHWRLGEWYLSLEGFDPLDGFCESGFDAVDSNLESDLRETTEPVPEECVLRYAP